MALTEVGLIVVLYLAFLDFTTRSLHLPFIILTYGDVTDYPSLLASCSGCHMLIHTATLVEPWIPDPSKLLSVYDVTPFLDDHPGGDEVLLLATEKDATGDFEDVGHSKNALNMMKDYYVGELDNDTMLQKTTYKPPPKTASESTQASGSSSTNILTFVLPILILVLAYALYYFTKKEVAPIA